VTPTTKVEMLATSGFFPNSFPDVEPHAFIGISLCLGFVFMLLVDRCCGGHSHTPGNMIYFIICLLCFLNFNKNFSSDVESNGRQNRGSFTATVGLVVHAAGLVSDFLKILFATYFLLDIIFYFVM
jgi:hypothetical protein